MADVETPTGYLSIGEVLGLLLEEFPDVTISKIRFLESQGLISPERTSSGYRKFYEHDVDLLRVILTEQRENYLPLRVIKDRLDSGEIDPTGEHLRPNGERIDGTPAHGTEPRLDLHHGEFVDDVLVIDELDHTPVEVPRAAIRSHPASRGVPEREPAAGAAGVDPRPSGPVPGVARSGHAPTGHTAAPAATAQLLPGVLLDRAELCAMVGDVRRRARGARVVRRDRVAAGERHRSVRRRRRRDRPPPRASSCGSASMPGISASGAPRPNARHRCTSSWSPPAIASATRGAGRGLAQFATSTCSVERSARR